MTPTLFFSQIIGSGARYSVARGCAAATAADPRHQADILIACAIRALVAPEAARSTGAIRDC